jgi:hypothetical protein
MTERKPLLAFTRRQILNVQPNGYKIDKETNTLGGQFVTFSAHEQERCL